MAYRDQIATIGNSDARLAELLRLGAEPGGSELLFEALWDPFPPIRHRAAEELAARLDAAMARRVAEVLTKQGQPRPVTPEVRRAAALALRAESLPDDVRRALQDVMQDGDDIVRYHALLALHRSADGAELRTVTEHALRDRDPGVAVVAAQIVAERRWDDLVPELNALFERLSGKDQFQIALALSELVEPESASEQMVDVLIDGLRDEKTLASACMALGRLSARRAIAPLKRVMSSFFAQAHPLNRVEAAAALVRIGDPEGVAYLEKMLGGRRKDTRGYAIELIASLGLEQYRQRIEEIARSNDYHADTAVLALRSFGDARALELLRDIAASHPDPEIRELAAETSAVDGTLHP